MPTTTLRLGDGFICVEPSYPPELQEALTYWHLGFQWDPSLHRRVVKGAYRKLFTEDIYRDEAANVLCNRLTTMPGFVSRVHQTLSAAGFDVVFSDERTPPPAPDLNAALQGARDYQAERLPGIIKSGGGIISWPTGLGKTFAMASIIRAFPQMVLESRGTPLVVVTTYSRDVCRKNAMELKTLLSDREVGLADGSTQDYSDDVQCITFDSLHKLKSDTIGILLVDECVSGASLITTEQGIVRLDEAQKRGCQYVLTPCGPRDTFKRILRYYEQGTRETLKIVTTGGTLICTPDHKIMTDKGWQTAATLIVNSRIRTNGPHATPLWWRRPLYAGVAVARRFIVTTVTRLRICRKIAQRRFGIVPTGPITTGESPDGTRNLTGPSLVSWLARCSGTAAWQCPMPALRRRDSVGITALSSAYGSSTKLNTLGPSCTSSTGSVQISDGAPLRATHMRWPIVSLFHSMVLYIRTVKKRLVSNCLICLPTRVSHGGFVMTAPGTHPLAIWLHTGLARLNRILCGGGLKPSIMSNSSASGTINDACGICADGLVIGFGLRRLLRRLFQGACNTNYVTVLSITSTQPAKVYDIAVQDTHCFYANGLLVHNCHTAATEGRTDRILDIKRALKWGLSATPAGRFDGGDLVTEGLLGPIVSDVKYQEGVAWGALVPITVCWLMQAEPDCGVDDYNKYSRRDSKMRRGIYFNSMHNEAVVRIIQRTPASRQTMAIMPFLGQMNALRELDNTIELAHAETDAGSLADRGYRELYAISKKERDDIYDRMAAGEIRKILSSGVYSTGVNFPELQVVIMAGGGGSELVSGQIPGRASRPVPGEKDESFIVDFWPGWDHFVDKAGRNKNGPLLSAAKARLKVYKALGFTSRSCDSIDALPFL